MKYPEIDDKGRYIGKRKLVKAGDFKGDKTFKLGDSLPSERASGGRTGSSRRSGGSTPKVTARPSTVAPKAGTNDSSTRPKFTGADPLYGNDVGSPKTSPKAPVVKNDGGASKSVDPLGSKGRMQGLEVFQPRETKNDTSAGLGGKVKKQEPSDMASKNRPKRNDYRQSPSSASFGSNRKPPKVRSTKSRTETKLRKPKPFMDSSPRVGLFPGMPVRRKK